MARVNASSPAELELHLSLGCGIPPGKAELVVEEVKPSEFNWLAVLESSRDHGYTQATGTKQVAGFTYPTLTRPDTDKGSLRGIDLESAAKLLNRKLDFTRGCDELEVLFYLHVDGLKSKGCSVFRIMQMADGKLAGGYTVVARKE